MEACDKNISRLNILSIQNQSLENLYWQNLQKQNELDSVFRKIEFQFFENCSLPLCNGNIHQGIKVSRYQSSKLRQG